MDAPPWRNEEEPDFMPRVRRTFAGQLPMRAEAIRVAMARLVARTDAGHQAAVEQMRSVVHDLSGTAATVGAEEIGRLATVLAGKAREWARQDTWPSEADLGAAGVECEALLASAEQFLGWMADEPSDA